jgi:hypothetical protein
MTSEITREELAQLVFEMRTSQKTFFRTKDFGVIHKCKDLERRVDELVEDILDKQPKLF